MAGPARSDVASRIRIGRGIFPSSLPGALYFVIAYLHRAAGVYDVGSMHTAYILILSGIVYLVGSMHALRRSLEGDHIFPKVSAQEIRIRMP